MRRLVLLMVLAVAVGVAGLLLGFSLGRSRSETVAESPLQVLEDLRAIKLAGPETGELLFAGGRTVEFTTSADETFGFPVVTTSEGWKVTIFPADDEGQGEISVDGRRHDFTWMRSSAFLIAVAQTGDSLKVHFPSGKGELYLHGEEWRFEILGEM